jgi:hypothetical protein
MAREPQKNFVGISRMDALRLAGMLRRMLRREEEGMPPSARISVVQRCSALFSVVQRGPAWFRRRRGMPMGRGWVQMAAVDEWRAGRGGGGRGLARVSKLEMVDF